MKILMRRNLHTSISSDPDVLVVNRAILMNPSDVYQFTLMKTKEVKKMLRGSWTLGGTVSGDKFAGLKKNMNNGLVHQMSITTSDLGAVYAVIATQLGEWQHRFVLPTFVGKAASLFAANSDKPLSLNFTSASGDDGFLFFTSVFLPGDYPVVLAGSNCMQDSRTAQYISEMSSVVRNLLQPSAVPSMSLTDDVSEVEVSFLLPWESDLNQYLQVEELEETI